MIEWLKENFNAKLRMKNWAFWAPLIVGAVSLCMGFLQMQPQDFDAWPKVGQAVLAIISNPYFVVSLLAYLVAAFTDTSTPGLTDSRVTVKKDKLTDTAADVITKLQHKEENEKALDASVKNNGGTK